jgi:hypothetical protein
MKKITVKKLEKLEACQEAILWFQQTFPKGIDPIIGIKELMKENRFSWANWFIVKIMTYKQYVAYAIYAAEQVIEICEKKYPDDKRPRKAIEAAKECLKNPSKKNKRAAAARAAWAAEEKGNLQQKIINYGVKLLEV